MHGQADLALGIFNRGTAFDTLLKTAARAGFAAPHMPWTLYEQFGPSLGWRYWLSGRQVLQDRLDRIARVSEGLADAESVQTLYRICAFRLGLDTGFASFQSSDAPYFNALTLADLRARAITYVDCGAYNGDTFFDLLEEPGIECSQAFLLEPDPANFDALVQRVALRQSPAVCLPLAVSNRHENLMFNVGQGEASAIQQETPAPVQAPAGRPVTAVALDQLLPSSRIDLLKLDIEGGEAQALSGARQSIQNSRPVLAVSLYHQPHDLWELPELLFDLCPRYQFYVRQHGFNTFDSVLYAVPDSPGRKTIG